jgi:dihydropyrimidine dehydrogenase (NAD+) subunit PreT
MDAIAAGRLTAAELERNFSDIHVPLDRKRALIEASRCYFCFDAPCLQACPTGIDIPGFIRKISTDNVKGAAVTILSENIMGGACARVCPVEVLCEAACVREAQEEKPVQIGALQRYATDWAYEHGVPLREPAPANGKGVAVVGAGPAGLAAAGELAGRGYAVTVFDEREQVGGLVRYAIAPYRQSNEPLPDEARLLGQLGVEFVMGTRIDPARLRALEEEFDAVVLAVGMGADANVSYEGDDLDGVWESLPFIEQLKTAKTPPVGHRVAVIGGGNTAVDVAVEAKRLGADVSLLLYRRTEAEMPAYDHEVELARKEGVEIRFLVDPVALVGNGRVTGVRCAQMRLGEPDESGRRRPEPVPGSEFVIPVDTVVKAIGQRPRDEFLSLLESVDDDGRTSNPRIFAAGDAINGGASVVQAVREAKRAVAAIDGGTT